MLSKMISKSKSKSNWAKRGAITVEYIAMFSAIIGMIIVFFRPWGTFHWAWYYSTGLTVIEMENMGQRLKVSRDGGGAGLGTLGAERGMPPTGGGGFGPSGSGNGDNTGQPGGSGPNTPN